MQTDRATWRIAPNEWPLHFRTHGFSAHCYNTLKCKVIYNDYDFTPQIEEQPSGARPANYQDSWSASNIGIDNFPKPAEVSWTSADGQEHHANVDIAEIFADQVVLHHVNRDEIPDGWAPGGTYGISPEIFLEVNDRTINVYMRSHIATKHYQIPGNKYSNYRNELILAWSRTY